MVTKGVHGRLWNFGCIHQSEIMSGIASGRDGRTGIGRITGETPDISEWLDFDIYDLAWILDNANAEKNLRLARWLGVAHQIGSDRPLLLGNKWRREYRGENNRPACHGPASEATRRGRENQNLR